jgi:hypothetical protein
MKYVKYVSKAAELELRSAYHRWSASSSQRNKLERRASGVDARQSNYIR